MLLVFTEETPLDIAAAYADFKVYSLIKERWDALPVVKDKKKTKKRASARPKSTPATALVSNRYHKLYICK